MQQLGEDDLRRIFGELVVDELKVIHEYLEDIPFIKSDMSKLKIDVDQLKSDMLIVKALLKDHGKQIDEYGKRVASLEANAHSHA